MGAQLSTSGRFKQLTCVVFIVLVTLAYGTTVRAQGSNWLNPSEVEIRIDPLSPVDQQFMDQQRQDIGDRARRLGSRLGGVPGRDLQTLQRLLDGGLVKADDKLGLQAMGIVLGDLLADRLDMDWVVYRDRAGRSRALRYRETDTYLFPVTMISRRWEVGARKPVAEIYDEAVAATEPRLPGASWR